MSSMDEAAGRLAHHLAHPTARACLPPLPLRSGFFSSFSLGALVYIRSNGKRYLLGGGLGFTLASSYLASLGGLWVGGVCTAKREGGHCVGGRVSRQDLVGQHAMRPKR